jgi:hypothetical protein
MVLALTNQKYKRRIIKLNFEQRFYYSYTSASISITFSQLCFNNHLGTQLSRNKLRTHIYIETGGVDWSAPATANRYYGCRLIHGRPNSFIKWHRKYRRSWSNFRRKTRIRIFNSCCVIRAESLFSKSKQIVTERKDSLSANEREKCPSKRKTYIGRIIILLHV